MGQIGAEVERGRALVDRLERQVERALAERRAPQGEAWAKGIAFEPTLRADYRRQIEALTELRAFDTPHDDETTAILRGLIDTIIASPGPAARGVSIELHGRLANIIAMATGKPVPDECMFVVERVKGIEPSS